MPYKDPELQRIAAAIGYLRNKKKVLARGKEWRKNNRARQNDTERRRYAANPEKAKARRRNWEMKNPSYHRPSHYKRKYGLTMEDVETMRLKQDNECAICRKEFTKHPHGRSRPRNE